MKSIKDSAYQQFLELRFYALVFLSLTWFPVLKWIDGKIKKIKEKIIVMRIGRRMKKARLDPARSFDLAKLAQDAAAMNDITSSEAFTRLVERIISDEE